MKTICILGKQGVGKTRFFSALTDQRYLNKPTIDFHLHILQEEGKELQINDMPDILERKVSPLCQEQLEQADLLVVLIDGSRPMDARDFDYLEYVRKSKKDFRVIVILGLEHYYSDADQVPSKNLLFATNLNEIEQVRSDLLSEYGDDIAIEIEDIEDEEGEEKVNDEPVKWIVVGRENAGKSTLVNSLSGMDRVLVSEKPGTTQMSVEIDVKASLRSHRMNINHAFTIKDTAGIKTNLPKYIHKLIEKRSLLIFVLDGVLGLTHHDKTLLNAISQTGLSCVIALNKSDEEDYDPKIAKELGFIYKNIPVVRISALKKKNLANLLRLCKKIEWKSKKRISTSACNKWCEDMKSRFHGVRVKYCYHAGLFPYRVCFFISPMTKDQSRLAHVKHLFQEYFDLEGVCMQMIIKATRSSERASQVPEQYRNKKI